MRIHLVQGHSAGALLRRATRNFGLTGKVRVINDDLSVGPLRDDQARNEWWVTVHGPYPDPHQPNLYDQWRAINADLGVASEVVLWSSNSGRDYVFERMAAFMLSDPQVDVFLVRAPASGKLEGVVFHEPAALAQMEVNKRALTTSEIADWSASFANDLRQSSGVRWRRQDSTTALPENALDEFLLERCPPEWTKWYRVVGGAMAGCDGQNLIRDAFFSWRLRRLVEAGRVEAEGDLIFSDGPKDVLVRRIEAN